MLTFSTAALIGSVLNTFVWPDEFVNYEVKQPVAAPAPETPAGTSEEQKVRFQTEQHNRFKNTATTSIGFILVGLPLWLFHWRQIQADRLDK